MTKRLEGDFVFGGNHGTQHILMALCKLPGARNGEP